MCVLFSNAMLVFVLVIACMNLLDLSMSSRLSHEFGVILIIGHALFPTSSVPAVRGEKWTPANTLAVVCRDG